MKPTEIKNILVVRFRRVGDAVLSTAICSSLRKSFPNAQIHYVMNENISSAFENHPDIDKVITFDEETLSSFSLYLKRVREIVKTTRYDVIIDTRSTLRTLFFSLFSRHTPYRIGKKKSYNLIAHNYPVDNRFTGNNDAVQMNLDLLQPLEKEYKITRVTEFKLPPTEFEIQESKEYLLSHGISFEKPVMLCTVTARLENKVWKREYMTEVLRRILEKYPTVQLIFNYGGQKEFESAKQIYEELGSPKNVFIHLEAKSLRQLMAICANIDFFFGNEGGPRHIAQALSVPSFAIYSPSAHKKEWLPNASEQYQGIELADIDATAAKDNKLSFEEKFSLIKPSVVWEQLETMLKKYLIKG